MKMTDAFVKAGFSVLSDIVAEMAVDVLIFFNSSILHTPCYFYVLNNLHENDS